MSYVYDTMISALGGTSLTKPTTEGRLVKGWSPNMFKRVVLLADGIFIDYHGKTPRSRVIPLDLTKVTDDLLDYKYKNPLRPLFEFKALSCLEELIVSPHLVSEKNLNTYTATLTSTHRLRAVAMAPYGLKVQDLQDLYSSFLADSRQGLLSEQIPGCRVQSTSGSTDYYRRYLLRPKLYELDSPHGQLHAYFKGIETRLSKEFAQDELETQIKSFLEYDRKDIKVWQLIVDFLLMKDNDDPTLTHFTSLLRESAVFNGRTYNKGLKDYFSRQDHKKDKLYRLYGSLGYFQDSFTDSPQNNQQGYFRPLSVVASTVYPEIGNLVAQKHPALESLKIPKNASKEVLLETVLEVLTNYRASEVREAMLDFLDDLDLDLDSETQEPPSTTEQAQEGTEEEVTSLKTMFPTKLVENLNQIITNFSHTHPDTAKTLFSSNALGTPSTVSSKGLDSSEVTLLEKLNITTSEDSTKTLEGMSLSESLDSTAYIVSRTFQELREKPWLGMDDLQKSEYILERMNR